MKWFTDISGLDALRKTYRKLVVRHHPDNGGSESSIKEINAEYDALFTKYKAEYEHSKSYGEATERQKQSYDPIKDQKIRDMAIMLSRYPGLIIELCGVWIWVFGNTKAYKDELKSLGLHYAKKKQCYQFPFPY